MKMGKYKAGSSNTVLIWFSRWYIRQILQHTIEDNLTVNITCLMWSSQRRGQWHRWSWQLLDGLLKQTPWKTSVSLTPNIGGVSLLWFHLFDVCDCFGFRHVAFLLYHFQNEIVDVFRHISSISEDGKQSKILKSNKKRERQYQKTTEQEI